MAADMMFAIFILFLVLAGLLIAWNNNLQALNDEQLTRSLERKAGQTMDVLIRTEGIPSNWETLSISQVRSIGLADSDRVMNETKLNAFKNFTGNYDEVREVLKLGTFHYFFSLDGIDDFNAGLITTADVFQVSTSRIVNYKGEEADATLIIYSLR